MQKEQLAWETVDPTIFPVPVQEAFAAIKLAKERFENLAEKALFDAGGIPAGMAVRFSDKWGKLSMALVKAPTIAGPGLGNMLAKLRATAAAAAPTAPSPGTGPSSPLPKK